MIHSRYVIIAKVFGKIKYFFTVFEKILQFVYFVSYLETLYYI